MASDFAAMLDEMMGPQRNVDLDKVTGRRRQFADPDVDKHHLAGCSPYALFRGTSKNEGYLNPREVERHAKMVCDDALRAEYEALPREEKDRLGYERDLYFLLEDLVARCDVRVRKAKEKLAEAVKRVEDKVNERRASWQVRIDEKMRLSEEAGEAGDVDRCQALVAEAEALREPMARRVRGDPQDVSPARRRAQRARVRNQRRHPPRGLHRGKRRRRTLHGEEPPSAGRHKGRPRGDEGAAAAGDGCPPRPPPKRARSPSRDATFRDDRRRRGREGREGREGRSRERDGGRTAATATGGGTTGTAATERGTPGITAAANIRGIEDGAGTRDGIAGGRGAGRGSVAATTETRAVGRAKGAEIETGGGERGEEGRATGGKTTRRDDGGSACARERGRGRARESEEEGFAI